MKKPHKNIVGKPINFRGLTYAPVNEQGVVLLFGMLARELGFHVQLVRQGYPDCKAVRSLGDERYEEVNIEFEFRSAGFKSHLKEVTKSDFIICWEHNWRECPQSIQVLELRSLIESGQLNELEPKDVPEKGEKQKIAYTLEDLIKENWEQSRSLLNNFEKGLKQLGKYKRWVNKFYISYSFNGNRSDLELVPQRQGLKVYLRPKKSLLASSTLELVDCERVGHWTNGATYFLLQSPDQLVEAVMIINQAISLGKKKYKRQ